MVFPTVHLNFPITAEMKSHCVKCKAFFGGVVGYPELCDDCKKSYKFAPVHPLQTHELDLKT